MNRRGGLHRGVVFFACLIGPTACSQRQPPAKTSVPTVVDPFADLLPLRHAEGNIFEAEARIVAFLHERLGFTVLAWEAGLWSCETDSTHCPPSLWNVAEARGVRPPPAGIHVTGFDLQFTGDHREDSAALLRAKLVAIFQSNPSLVARLNVGFERFPKMQHFHALTAGDRTTDRDAFREALGLLRTREDIEDRPLIERSVENVLGLYDWHEAVNADVSTTVDWNHHTSLNNVRDHAMAENVLWLLKRYPGQKIILWAANMHITRDLSVVGETRGPEYASALTGYKTMGSFLSAALGAAYFALATTAYEGEIGNRPGWVRTIPPANPGSLEAEWCPASAPSTFVALREDRSGSRGARFLGFESFTAPWSKVFDAALVFRQRRATNVSAPRKV
jgi:hypothetical protein